MVQEKTTVEITDEDLETLINPGAASVLIPEEKTPGLFTRKPDDTKFIDKIEKEDVTPVLTADELAKKIASGEYNEDGTSKVIPATVEDINDITSGDDDTSKTGRPKVDKQGLVELTNKLIEKKILVPFDDEKPIDKYTLQDFEELFEANAQEKERKLNEELPIKFFDSLPEELQVAAKYVADGGQDLKGLFHMLAATREIQELNPADANSAETIVKSYLQATRFGTPDEIQEEINAWKDRNELETKAKKFKPKLDQMQEEIVAYKLQEQEEKKKQQQAHSKIYMNNVYKVLQPGELNGIKLDKKSQSMLYAGLIQPNYPSISGKQTNLLGHLLEKYQFIEPNHALIAEALWLLADPEGYRNKVREVAKKEQVEKTVRALKSEEQRKIASGTDDDENEQSSNKQNKIPRSGKGFFQR